MKTETTFLSFIILLSFGCLTPEAKSENKQHADTLQRDTLPGISNAPATIKADTALFNKRLRAIFHNKPAGAWMPDTSYPLAGSILPYKRIIAYYGNFYSKGMGILGELPPNEMLTKLGKEVKKWEQADTLSPVQPALHYIAVTAQGKGGRDKKYRLRMPFQQIDKAVELAKNIDAIVFLDIQVGHSTLQQEVPLLEKYFRMPNVHLGIDPEFSMHGEQIPSGAIGTFDAADINYATEYLAGLVKQYNLPPKILIVHRFTTGMVTNYKKIIKQPQVQIVMHMDGFGIAAKKISSYKLVIENQPVQYTGIKIFYKQDKPKNMEPAEILKLYPQPVYIQYQ